MYQSKEKDSNSEVSDKLLPLLVDDVCL